MKNKRYCPWLKKPVVFLLLAAGFLLKSHAQVIVGDFWATARFRTGGLSLKQVWNTPHGRAGLVLSGHDENFEPKAVQMLLPKLSRTMQGLLTLEPDPTFTLKTLVLDVVRREKNGFILAYDETRFKPILFAYDRIQVRRLRINWEKAAYLFLKALTIVSRDTLLAVGYLEGEDGRLRSRSSVVVQIFPHQQRAQIITKDVPDTEDGFLQVVVTPTLFVSLGTIGRASTAGSRIIAFAPGTFETRWEKTYPNLILHKLVALPDGRIAAVGERNHSATGENRGVVLILDKSGREMLQWVNESPSGNAFLDATLTIDGYLGICGYQRVGGKTVPVLWKFDYPNEQVLLTRQWMDVTGKFTRLTDLPSGFLVVAGQARDGDKKIGIVAVEQEINPVTFPPEITVQAAVADADGDGKIAPGESFTLNIAIQNTGRTAAYNPLLNISVQNPGIRFKAAENLVLPVIYPGQEYRLKVRGVGKAGIGLQRFPVTISILENNGLDLAGQSSLATTTLYLQGTMSGKEPIVRIKAIPSFVVAGDTATVQIVVENVSRFVLPPGTISFLTSDPAVKILNSPHRMDYGLAAGNAAQFELTLVSRDIPATRNVPIVATMTADNGSLDFEATTELLVKGNAEMVAESGAAEAPEPATSTLKLNPAIDIEANIPKFNQQNPNRFAVIIGISDYRPPVPRVPYAIRDAFVMKEYVKNVWGVPEGNVFFLPNATKSDLERFFGDEHDYRGKLYNMLQPNKSEVIVFYSGHGAPGREKGEGNYLVPVDADPAYLKLNGYALNTFLNNLSHLPAKSVLVIMDACFSGQIYTGISPVYVYVPPQKRFPPNFAVLSSTTATQPSCWLPEKGHSLFTYLLLKGIQTFQADLNNDGKITLKEMEQYLTDDTELSHSVPYQARRIQNVEQRPHLMTSNPNLVLVEK